MATDRKRISAYLTPEKAARIEELAAVEERTVSSMVAKILSDWLKQRAVTPESD
jgi:hypothetical protein